MQIGHLLTAATIEKMKINLVRFIRKGSLPAEAVKTSGHEKYKMFRKPDEGDIQIPEASTSIYEAVFTTISKI